MAKEVSKPEVGVTSVPTKFRKRDLIASAHVFGTTRALMTGALYGKPEEMTKEDAEKAVKAFLGAPVRKGDK